MRPTAERVLCSLASHDGQPAFDPVGNTTEELATFTSLSAHVVRARLCDLRRLGLVESDWYARCHRGPVRYAHCLTDNGLRRAGVAKD